MHEKNRKEKMMIKRIAFQLLGEKYTKLAIAWHQFITY